VEFLSYASNRLNLPGKIGAKQGMIAFVYVNSVERNPLFRSKTKFICGQQKLANVLIDNHHLQIDGEIQISVQLKCGEFADAMEIFVLKQAM